jgi:hypothetical protein
MQLLVLLTLASTGLGLPSLPHQAAVNDVIDMVESGLGESKAGRALFITLTITDATTVVETTTTMDGSLTTYCLAAAVEACPVARSGVEQDAIKLPAILTTTNGEKVDVSAIKPTKMFDGMDIDGIIHENEAPISSGSLTFKEVCIVTTI